jgi:GDPmannose 4,6-dehydratase
MWRILQQDTPGDYVLATGKAYRVRDFVERAFAHTGIEIAWEGRGVNEVGIDPGTGRTLVEVDPRYFRPTEVNHLEGDPTRAREQLGWEPKFSFDDLVRDMVESDRDHVRREHNARRGDMR